MVEKQSLKSEKKGSKFQLSRRAERIDDGVFKTVLDLPQDILRLAAGEPDYPSAPFVNEAAVEALTAGQTHYEPPAGIMPLREEIARKLKKENGLSYDPLEIIVTPGASAAVNLLLLASIDPGDEVLIPDPAWFHYATLVDLVGGRPKRIPLDPADGFRLRAAEIEELATPNTKVLIINTPSNPTGRVLSSEELGDVAGVAERLGISVVSDEVYEKIVYPPYVHKSFAALSGMRDRTAVVNGLSKGYAMTGWRVGYVAAPLDLIRKLSSLLGYTLLCAGSVAQFAALEALRNPKSRDYTKKMVSTWRRRMNLMMKSVEENQSIISALPPEGTFYGWLNVSGSGMSGKEAARRILDEAKVGVLPGYIFGNQGRDYIRVSFATPDNLVEEGMNRLCGTLKT